MKTIMAPHTPVVVSPSGNGIIKSDRRASKPLMEKRRRERINKSLNELKSILLDALRKDSTCHSKLEKADILEMTVRYLRSIQRQRITAAMALDPSVLSKYRAGFVECKAEVTKFLENSTENLHPDVKSRLMTHLGNNTNVNGHPHMMAGNPHAQLMTTGPPMPAGAAMQPMPIQLSPNTQMHAMAAAAAAMAGNARNHGFLVGGPHQGMPPTSSPNHFHMDNRQHSFSSISPSSSPIHHSRHTSGSSNGKCSPDYNSSSPSLSPVSHHGQQYHPMSPQVHKGIQGSFVVMPNSAPHFIHSPPVHQHRVPTSHKTPSPYREQPMSPISPVSSPHSMTSSSPRKHCYPSEEPQQPFVNFSIKSEPRCPPSPGSDGSEPVWRPW